MKRSLFLAFALAGCAQLGARPRTDYIVAPNYACRAAAWQKLAQVTPHPQPEQWWEMVTAAQHANESNICCLGPNGYETCPASLGLTYKELDDFQAARQAAAKAAQQTTDGKVLEQLQGPAKPAPAQAPK